MMKVYFDNAATTPLSDEVLQEMIPILKDQFGNPSSTHSFGRQVRSKIEIARRKVASLIHSEPSEICFTSGGTEADNMAIRCSVQDLGVTHIITSKIEHHAVLHTAEEMAKKGIHVSFVQLDSLGGVDMNHLEELLQGNEKTLVSLMHANNEVGTLISLKEVSALCRKYDALFHSDTVQTMGHYDFNLKELDLDFLTCSAHKLHGPKGVGFLYINQKLSLNPMIFGGSQERNRRGGTENVYGIVGLAKALEEALTEVDSHHDHIQGLKTYMIEQLEANIPGVDFNGDAKGESLYTVLNVSLPPSEKSEILLFSLDLMGIACSGGSACSSGSDKGSHVLNGIGSNPNRPAIRFSFSKYNTKEEVDYAVSKLKEIYFN
ncbi:cysteine desulfurase [Salibacteraceae bacterium]|nr:cysteine desulfurase [Salibacteraceae bacterium]